MADEVPTWFLRKELIRRAEEIIRGRADFVKHVRPSTKPLPKIEVDPHDLLRLLREPPETLD